MCVWGGEGVNTTDLQTGLQKQAVNKALVLCLCHYLVRLYVGRRISDCFGKHFINNLIVLGTQALGCSPLQAKR